MKLLGADFFSRIKTIQIMAWNTLILADYTFAFYQNHSIIERITLRNSSLLGKYSSYFDTNKFESIP